MQSKMRNLLNTSFSHARPRARLAEKAYVCAQPSSNIDANRLDHAVSRTLDTLLAQQHKDGHWVFELEADATIPAEYVLLTHYLGERADSQLEAKIAAYLRRIQHASGGWPLFYGGAAEVSASVKAYFALKMIGDSPDAPHMRRARAAIRALGGAEASNVFTRILLALFGIVRWRAVPSMPVEIMLLPRWFPFHLSKVSYWARTVIAPLLVLGGLRPVARNPRGVKLDELFIGAPDKLGLSPRASHQSCFWFGVFRAADAILRILDPLFPKALRQRAIDRAVAFVTERLNGENGFGGIFPAMANAVMMFDALGYPPDHRDRAVARASIDRLLVVKDHEAYCQPCLSPVWDTSLLCHALIETGEPRAFERAQAGLEWLRPLQVLDVRGDWTARRAKLRPGGWAFQYANPYYPDVDDTAVVAMAMDRAARALGDDRYRDALSRAREWIIGMQSSNGGWGAFEPENTHLYLNNIPFADHGALLDPPTVDVSARCLSLLIQLGELERSPCSPYSLASETAMPSLRQPSATHHNLPASPQAACAVARALGYLRREQRADGSWYGRWGVNHIYGTWAALCALAAAGAPSHDPAVDRAIRWLMSIQNDDGGWGEDGSSYRLDYRGYQRAPSTASQTAWALLGLMAASDSEQPAVARGIDYLLRAQMPDGLWDEPQFTATGFPRVFYLRYHGYAKYFPLWALARYRNLKRGGRGVIACGM